MGPFVALPRQKFVTGAILLQLHQDVNSQQDLVAANRQVHVNCILVVNLLITQNDRAI
jgi:hypothetical protein